MMKKSMQIVLMTFVLAMVAAVSAGIASAEVKFGMVPRLSPAELHRIYDPLAEYLTREIGEKVTIVIPKDFNAYNEAVRTGKMDIGFANPLIYVKAKAKTNIEPLVLSAWKKDGTRLRGVIVVRKDSGITNLQDLKGKKIAFVEKDSGAGYIFQMFLMSKAGLNVRKDITVLPFTKRHDAVIMDVYNKKADAGGVRDDEIEKLKDKIDISQLRIVGYTDYFPNWPVFATPKFNKATAAKIRAALLKLKPNDPKNENIIGAASLTGFIPTSDSDFDSLEQAAKITGAL
jgi:phosphonate transport system substrate-binding protein